MQSPKVHPPPKGIPRHWEGGQEGGAKIHGRSSPTHPPPTHTQPAVYRSPQGCQDPPPKTDFLTPGLDSFSLNLQAPKNRSLPALAGSMKHQMPSPRTQVGVESKESSSPAPTTTRPTGRESQFCLQGPIKDLRAHTLVQRTQGRCLLHLGEESGT